MDTIIAIKSLANIYISFQVPSITVFYIAHANNKFQLPWTDWAAHISSGLIAVLCFLHWRKGSDLWVKISPYIFMATLVLIYLIVPLMVAGDCLYWCMHVSTQYMQTYNVFLVSVFLNKVPEFYHAIWKTACFEALYFMKVK